MEVFKVNRRILEKFGMCLNNEETSKSTLYLSRSINLLMFWISLCTVLVSIEYITSHFDDTENILFAVMQVVANTASGGGYWAFYQKKYKVSQLIVEIGDLVKERCRLNNFMEIFYQKAERKSIFVSTWPLILFCVNYDVVLIISTTFTVIFELIPAKSDPATWYAMYKMR